MALRVGRVLVCWEENMGGNIKMEDAFRSEMEV